MFSDAPYRKYIWETEKRILNELLARYFDKRIENYLDFACGTGRILAHLEPHARQSVGLDLSESMLEVAAQGGEHIQPIERRHHQRTTIAGRAL